MLALERRDVFVNRLEICFRHVLDSLQGPGTRSASCVPCSESSMPMVAFLARRRGHSMKTHFEMMASYNAWANARLFRMAGALVDELYRKEVGAYFKSLHGTLNHLLVADRI